MLWLLWNESKATSEQVACTVYPCISLTIRVAISRTLMWIWARISRQNSQLLPPMTHNETCILTAPTHPQSARRRHEMRSPHTLVKTNNSMLVKQVTLWLVPPNSVAEKLQTNIVDLCKQTDGASAPFVPHVTIIGGIPCESDDTLKNLTEKLQKGLQGTGSVPCRFRQDVETMYHDDDSLVWNQACVSVVKQTKEFMAFHKHCRNILNLNDEEWEFPPPLREPHLSHFYGTTVPPASENVLVAPDFDAVEAALWETSGGYEGVKNWRELARIKLI